MSTERRELTRISAILAAYKQQDTSELTDLALLKSIVDHVKQRQQKANKELDDSLAFDTETRARLMNQDTASAAQEQLWRPLDKFDDQLRRDYTCRRQMLLTRLDCTVESFKRKGANNREPKGGKAKTMNEQIHETYEKARLALREEPQVGLAHLLAARQTDCDRLLNAVVSGSRTSGCRIKYGDKRTQSDTVQLKQVIIPTVPDRGGRTDEIRPPPRETFGQRRGRGCHRAIKQHGRPE